MKEASTIRIAHIIEEQENFSTYFYNDEHFESEIKNTLFEEYLKSSDIGQDDLKRFAFSSYITRKVLDKYSFEINSLEDVFFLSKVIEHGYYKLITDFNSSKLSNSLAIAKEFGAFYTPIGIAREMAARVVEGSSSGIIIDPCCGTGNLLAACLEYSAKKNIKLKKLVGIDIDGLSCEVCRNSLEKLSASLGIQIEIEILNSNALDILAPQTELFSSHIPAGSIIINPPYGKLKFDSDRLSNAETKLGYKELHKEKKVQKNLENQHKVRRVLNSLDLGKGVLEWSKVFLSLCINYLPSNETMVFLGPCSWLSSKSYAGIRERIIKARMLNEVHFISESNAGFETVNQPLSIVTLASGSIEINLLNDFSSKEALTYKQLNKLKSHGYAIPRVNVPQLQLFLKLQNHKKIKEITELQNFRGELDLSLNKTVISTDKSSLKVVRGDNFSRFVHLPAQLNTEAFANIDEFQKQIGNKPKGKHHKRRRIVGRQCSYMKQKRRLVFTLFPENCVLGNSCNYLLVPDEDIYFYLGLLNSALMDWYFRVINGNNHVANYEIDDFPIPKASHEIKRQISNEVLNIMETASTHTLSSSITYFNFESKLDYLVFTLFKLSENEMRLVLENNHDEDYTQSVLQYL